MKRVISILLFLSILIPSLLYRNITIANGSQLNYFDKLQITRNTELEADHLKDIAFNGTNMIVIVGVNGKILTSPDGENWVIRTSGTDENLRKVIWYNKMFIAFGDNNTILKSNDGKVWHQLKEIKSKNNMTITYEFIQGNGTKYSNEAKLKHVFSDGKIFIGLNADIEAEEPIEYINNINDVSIFYSKDSKSWVSVDLNKDATNLKKLFVKKDDNKVYKGNAVIVRTTIEEEINAIASDSKKFMRVKNCGILSSTNGVDWDPVYQTDSIGLNDIVWTGKCYIVVGNYGKILSSKDGIKWVDKRVKLSRHFNNIMWDGKNYIIVGEYGTILKSNNIKNWTKVNSGVHTDFRSIIFDGKKYIVVGGGNITPVETVMVSKDLKKWEPYLSIYEKSNREINNIYLYGGRYILIRDDILLSSKDCVDWDCPPELQRFMDFYYDICWNGKLYILVGLGGTIASSKNCEDWNGTKLPNKEWLSSIACNSSMFVAVGTCGRILTSKDGVKWTYQNSGTNKWLKSVAWNGKYFIAVGEKGTIVLSEDGVNWKKVNTNNSNTLNKVICNGNDLLIVGDCGTLLTCKFK